VVEEGVHGDAEGFVVAVDGSPAGWFASEARAANAGQDGGDDLVAKDKDSGDGASRFGWYVIAPSVCGLGHEMVAAEFAQVVGGLADGVVGQGADGVNFGARSATVNPPGAAASATTAARTVRVRDWSKSMRRHGWVR